MVSEVRVRTVRPGEEALWYAVRPPRSGAGEAFTTASGYRPESRLVAERDGAAVGRMDLILVEPHEVVLFHPEAVTGADLAEVAGTLVAEGVRVAASLGTSTTTLLLMTSMPRMDDLIPLAGEWGFVPQKVKRFYRAPADAIRWDLGVVPAGCAFRAAAAPDDPLLVTTYARVLADSYESGDAAASDLALYAERCRRDGCFHVGDWEVLVVDDAPAGIVVPAFADCDLDTGTNLHVGLVPEARGRGLGAMLHLRGLAATRRRGAVRFIGSTDVRNVPMQHVFERVGYVCSATQHEFVLPRG